MVVKDRKHQISMSPAVHPSDMHMTQAFLIVETTSIVLGHREKVLVDYFVPQNVIYCIDVVMGHSHLGQVVFLLIDIPPI